MKKITLFLLLIGFASQASSITFVPVSPDDTDNLGVSIQHSIRNKEDNLSNTFLSNEPINFQFTIKTKESDIGQAGKLYLLARYKGIWFQNVAGKWQVWDKTVASILPFKDKLLEQNEVINVLNKERLKSGEFLVYGGYLTERDQNLFYNSSSAAMVVFDENVPSLHQVKSKPLLESFFAHGSSYRNGIPQPTPAPMPEASTTPTPSTPAPAPEGVNDVSSASVSQTNLQEVGVDEADRVKTDGEQLYALENCETDRQKQCITAYDIQANPATNTKLGQFDVDAQQSGSLYLAKIKDKKHLVHLNNSSTFPILDLWYEPSVWNNNKLDLKFIDVSQPASMQATTQISLDTSLISSRLVNGVLYLVTRKTARYDSPLPVDIVDDPPPVDVPVPAPAPATKIRLNSDPEYNPVPPPTQDINDLLPTISINGENNGVPIVQATDCYIPSQNSYKRVDNTVITITAIPLNDPKKHHSTCIAGNIDTFYMSPKALYLTSSQYPVSIAGNTILYEPGNSEMETEIHKFVLAEGALDYRGSGTVQGHLGWETDKQSFRMGEHNDILKVATSKGNAWGETSTTSVTVLQEAVDSKTLKKIGMLDNLGKSGDKLYAARFIGARGYLVTFKKVDPLYVLDFTQPEQPKVLGELEINGFSDYLHPIGENYLLGIGKDAISIEGEEFSWYQGLKLSLFDVSSGDNLREIESLVIGKRGTESTVLMNHHGLAWLATGDSATLAIPVQLNEQESSSSYDDYSQPSAFYDWTQTGLYTFNINTGNNPGIELDGKLITDIPPAICNEPGNYCSFVGQQIYNDRAVLQENSVHYIHNNAVHSSALADLVE